MIRNQGVRPHELLKELKKGGYEFREGKITEHIIAKAIKNVDQVFEGKPYDPNPQYDEVELRAIQELNKGVVKELKDIKLPKTVLDKRLWLRLMEVENIDAELADEHYYDKLKVEVPPLGEKFQLPEE